MPVVTPEIIVFAGRTAMSRLIPPIARKEVFGLGKCEADWDRLFKMYALTELLDDVSDGLLTQEEQDCVQSELLNDIQSPENLQATRRAVKGRGVSGTGVVIVSGAGGG